MLLDNYSEFKLQTSSYSFYSFFLLPISISISIFSLVRLSILIFWNKSAYYLLLLFHSFKSLIIHLYLGIRLAIVFVNLSLEIVSYSPLYNLLNSFNFGWVPHINSVMISLLILQLWIFFKHPLFPLSGISCFYSKQLIANDQ